MKFYYTPQGVVLAQRARFSESLRRDDGALERKRACVRLDPLSDACAIARHPERRDSRYFGEIYIFYSDSRYFPRFHPIKRLVGAYLLCKAAF